MCELFGLSSDRKIDVTAELREFFKHGEYNPHGWGMASWDDEGTVAIVKEPVKSTESAKINELLASGFSSFSATFPRPSAGATGLSAFPASAATIPATSACLGPFKADGWSTGWPIALSRCNEGGGCFFSPF